MKVFTREKAKEILLERGDKCLVIPEGYTETAFDFALLYDEKDIKYHFTSIHIASTVQKINGIFLTEYDPYTCDLKFFKEILVSSDNAKYCSVDGILFSKDMKELIAFPCGKYLKKYNVPDGVEKIADKAFSFNCFLRKIILPDTIKNIGDRAFECSDRLESVNIPNGIENMGNNCFTFAGNIHRIFIPDSLKMINSSNITSAGVFVFPETLKIINVDSVQTDYSGEFVEPILLSQNNLAVEEFAETYGFNYFSDYVIDENDIIWSSDRKTLIDFPKKWDKDTYVVPSSVDNVFRWAFNYSDIKHVVFDHKIKITGKSSGEDFSRLCSVDTPRYDKDFIIQSVLLEDTNEIKSDSTNLNDTPYIFISYAHKDAQQILPIIGNLINNGYNIWYDEGIDPGTEWDENIASHVENCGMMIAFMSNNYINSNNCKDELNYARDLDKNRLLVYLEDVKLPGGMAMRLNRLQSIHKYKYKNEYDFYNKLYSTPNIDKYFSKVEIQ